LAIKTVAKEALTLGVIKIKKDVTKLIVKGGVCLRVKTGNNCVTANITIIAAGL
jgi:glycine/D-amino acid oxidase-like deaminating enzyme